MIITQTSHEICPKDPNCFHNLVGRYRKERGRCRRNLGCNEEFMFYQVFCVLEDIDTWEGIKYKLEQIGPKAYRVNEDTEIFVSRC